MTEGDKEGMRVKPRQDYEYLKFSLCSLTKPLEYVTISSHVRALWSFPGHMTKTDFRKHSIFEGSRRATVILYFRRKGQTNDLDISRHRTWQILSRRKVSLTFEIELLGISHSMHCSWEFFFISTPQARSSDS